MPNVNFVGTIENASIDFVEQLSLTWGIIPGNAGWSLRKGDSAGETQISASGENGVAILNHPIDAFYETTTAEGWPFIVCEVWDKSTDGVKGFCGCGSAWLPPSSGQHIVDVHLWKPSASGLEAISEMLLPSVPDLKRLRELIVSPYMRSQVQTDSIGTVRVQITTTLYDFDSYGVSTQES